jgi:hypothetical protein
MASPQIMQRLQLLRAPSDVRLSDSVIAGMTHSFTQARYQLIQTVPNRSGPGSLTVPTNGVDSLLTNVQARRRLMVIPPGQESGYTKMLNDELLGGESYPILTAVLGTVAGAVSGGAGLIFTVVTTAIDASRTTQRVLVRPGDELWQVEEIGKNNGGDVVHVGSYFLYDPYRLSSGVKGWLISEERTTLDC